ncbi:phosphate-starvation-inducible PsiE family protein [Candidatus Nanosalina sp. VS9-1]|uniref:phosphate-starvation-inducible PsiE family protein n=1 Tax=Candidatus Nanosalina sp. VS9-1 TaxID=3388566 RepID=UPI0039E14277
MAEESDSRENYEELVKDVSRDRSGLEATLAKKMERVMDYLQLAVVVILVILFGIAVYDLGLELYELIITGQFYDPISLIGILETALLLFLIVEVFRTSVAHLEGLKVLPLVVDVAIIGIVRSIITFRLDDFQTMTDAVLASLAYAIILSVLIASFFIVHRQQRKSPEKHFRKVDN